MLEPILQIDFPADDIYHDADTRAKGYVKLKSKGRKFNPPIHKGCVCHIVPELETRVKGWTPVKKAKDATTALEGLGLHTDYDNEKAFVRAANAIGINAVHMKSKFPKLAGSMRDKPLVGDLSILNRNILQSSGGKTCGGLYYYDYDKIEMAVLGRSSKDVLHLKDWTIGNDIASTFRHEYGHHYFDRVMDYNGRMNFRKKFKDFDWGKVSMYAETNTKEAFSEAFSAYTSPLYGTTSGRTLPGEVSDYLKELLGE